ncbi:MAG TPA: hypothetical protein VGS11_01030 [Candidatus Bathyarchaeia archaeon]|nr:hypothetical protein [Candidatus Bathyarchaeia archaeon]
MTDSMNYGLTNKVEKRPLRTVRKEKVTVEVFVETCPECGKTFRAQSEKRVEWMLQSHKALVHMIEKT